MKDELLLAEEKAWNCTNMIVILVVGGDQCVLGVDLITLGVDLITRSVVSQSFAAPTFM